MSIVAGDNILASNFTGFIWPYAGSSAPTGFLLCDGSAVSRTTYAGLFAITSTAYGAGDGSTTFNVPDLRSRVMVGKGTGTKVFTFSSRASSTITVTGATNSSSNENQTGQAFYYHSSSGVITGLTNDTTYYLIRVAYNQFQLATSIANAIAGTAITLSSDGSGTQTFTQTLTARALGDTGGEEIHALTSNEMPAHVHTIQLVTSGSGSGVSFIDQAKAPTGATATSSSTGGSTPHNIMEPYAVVNYVIKT